MTVRYLDICCLLLTLLPGLPAAMASIAYEQACLHQPHAGFSAKGEVTVPDPYAPMPLGNRESRDTA
jgi:hypothetical protein